MQISLFPQYFGDPTLVIAKITLSDLIGEYETFHIQKKFYENFSNYGRFWGWDVFSGGLAPQRRIKIFSRNLAEWPVL